MRKILDTQGYWGPTECWGFGQDTEGYRILQGKLKSLGYYVKFLIMPYTTNQNSNLPAVIHENPDLFLGAYLQINPNEDYTSMMSYSKPETIERLIRSDKEDSLVGLKLHTSLTKTRVDDPILDEFSRIAVDHDIPILFHCAASGHDFTRSDYFRNLLTKHPDLKIICAHYGGLNERYILGDYFEEEGYIAGYVELVKDFRKNVWLNTSGLNGEKRRWNLIKEGEKTVQTPYTEYDPNRWKSLFSKTIDGIKDNLVFAGDFPELWWWTTYPVNTSSLEVQHNVLYENTKNLFDLRW